MEFHEKLQILRKQKGITQEMLAEALYVSRTAVSKWESGRGYPSIDSLKEISKFFSVTIDDLLSGEKLISIAERENRSNIRNVCDLMLGITDLFTLLLIVLPLYPKTAEDFVYAVNLVAYSDIAALNRLVYWLFFAVLILVGLAKVMLCHCEKEKGQKLLTGISMTVGILAVLLLGLAGETYAVAVAFLLLLVKSVLLFRCRR